MAVKVAINGFGRIGRLVARAILERADSGLELVAINDLADAKANALLFKRDSVHGPFPGEVSAEGDTMYVNGKAIRVTKERDPANLPHAELGVDIALECTGFFADAESAGKHLAAGAKRVLISAPAKGVDLALGVTHAPYKRVLDAMTADRVKLIFAGHTHGGQVCVPLYGALTTNCDLPTKAARGLSKHKAAGRTSWLHVSAGLGSSPMAPYRFACPPEATLVSLTARPVG